MPTAGAMPASPQPSPTEEPTPGTPVAFRTPDGVRIAGRVFGNGTVGVVLAHQIDGDQRDWWSFAEELADDGYRALTIDFRGYCPGDGAGCSGDGGTADAWRDLAAAAEWLRGRGARRIVLVGASMGGTAAAVAGAEGGSAVDGVIALSAPAACCGMTPERAALRAAGIPMLFLAGNADGEAAPDARQLARRAGADAEAVIVDSGEHGVDLIGGLAAPDIERRTTQEMLAFLERVAEG
jgi:pimeloyl-ACP methyl ester carboxylesterase